MSKCTIEKLEVRNVERILRRSTFFNSFNSKCRRKSTIANADTRYPKPVYPPNFPPPIFTLQSKKFPEINFVPNSDRIASYYAH